MAADGKTPPNPPTGGGGGNIMCTCSIFVCRHKNNDMSTLLGHAHTYIPTDRQTDRQTHRHTYINQYKHIVIPIHGCVCVSYPPFGGGGNQGGLDHIYIVMSVVGAYLWGLWASSWEPEAWSQKRYSHPREKDKNLGQLFCWSVSMGCFGNPGFGRFLAPWQDSPAQLQLRTALREYNTKPPGKMATWSYASQILGCEAIHPSFIP